MTYKMHFSEVPGQSQFCLCNYAEKNAGANQKSWTAVTEELKSVWPIASSFHGYAAHPKTGQSLPGFQTSVSWTGVFRHSRGLYQDGGRELLRYTENEYNPTSLHAGSAFARTDFLCDPENATLAPDPPSLTSSFSAAQEWLSCLPESAHGAA